VDWESAALFFSAYSGAGLVSNSVSYCDSGTPGFEPGEIVPLLFGAVGRLLVEIAAAAVEAAAVAEIAATV